MPIRITVQTSGGGPLLDFDFNPEASFPPPPGGQVEQDVYLLWFDAVMTPKNYSLQPAGPLAFSSELGTLQRVAWRVKYNPTLPAPPPLTVGFAFLKTGLKSPVTCFCIPKGQDLYSPPSPATFVQVGWVSA
jgi:hypothetical protein